MKKNKTKTITKQKGVDQSCCFSVQIKKRKVAVEVAVEVVVAVVVVVAVTVVVVVVVVVVVKVVVA